ncbi:MAG: 3-hydroxyacyl-ACP dehydratase FabZ family protein [Planctomycetota bacterium]
MTTTDGNGADRAAIQAAIPHRDPFLLLDRVVEEGEGWLLAEWTVPADGAWFQGHFPGQPVTPGVLLAEHSFQAAAVLISHALDGFGDDAGVPVLTRIQDARYRRRVDPGETLRTRVEVDEIVGPAWYLRAKIALAEDGAKVATLRFCLTSTGAVERLGLG